MMKKKMKLYTTYGRLYYKGKPQEGDYPVQVKASSRAEAIKFAKAYHAAWNKQAKRIKSDRGYMGKYVRIKPKRRRKK